MYFLNDAGETYWWFSNKHEDFLLWFVIEKSASYKAVSMKSENCPDLFLLPWHTACTGF